MCPECLDILYRNQRVQKINRAKYRTQITVVQTILLYGPKCPALWSKVSYPIFVVYVACITLYQFKLNDEMVQYKDVVCVVFLYCHRHCDKRMRRYLGQRFLALQRRHAAPMG